MGPLSCRRKSECPQLADALSLLTSWRQMLAAPLWLLPSKRHSGGLRVPEDMFSEVLQAVLRALPWAIVLIVSVADLERCHKRTKSVLNSDVMMMYSHFAAQSFLEDLTTISGRCAAVANAMVNALSSQEIKPAITSALPPPATVARNKSGYELFVDDEVTRVELARGSTRDLLLNADGRDLMRAK